MWGRKKKDEKKEAKKEEAKPSATPTTAASYTAAPVPKVVAKPKLISSTVTPKSVSASGDPSLPPMPNETELNEKYKDLLQELGIGEDQRKAMLAFPSVRKWTLICQHKGKTSEGSNTPQFFVDALSKDLSADNILTLRVTLASSPMSWLSSFIELDGLALLFKRLEEYHSKPSKDASDVAIISECVRCTRALMNARAGLDAVCNTPGAIDIFIRTLDCVDDKLRIIILEVLAALCLIRSDDTLLYYHVIASVIDKYLEQIVDLLTNGDDSLKVASMTLLNALINGISELAQRQNFRSQWKLGDLIKILRTPDISSALDTQFDIYDEVEADDINPPIIYKDPTEALRNLTDYVRRSPISEEAISIFEDLLAVPKDPLLWNLIDIFVQKSAVVYNENNDKLQLSKALCSAVISEVVGVGFEASSEETSMSQDEVIFSLKSKITTLNEEISNLKNSSSSADNLKKKLTSLTNELESLRQDKESSERNLEETINLLNHELEGMKNAPREVIAPQIQSNNVELERQLEELKQELDSSKRAVAAADNSSLKNQLSELMASESKLKNRIEELTIAYENASLQAKIVEDLRSKLTTASSELEILRARENTAPPVAASESGQQAELQGRIVSLSEQLGAKAASVASLESQLQEAQAKLNSTNVLLSNANIETTKLRGQLSEVEKKLAEVEKKLAEAEKKSVEAEKKSVEAEKKSAEAEKKAATAVATSVSTPAPAPQPVASGVSPAALEEANQTIAQLRAELLAAKQAGAPAADGTSATPPPAPPAPPPPPGGGPPAPPAPPPPPGGGPPAPPAPPPPPGGAPRPPGPPPPPGGKGPPGPPPPPGMKGKAPGAPAGRPQKREIKPSQKLRGLNWVAVPAIKVDNTFWDKADDEKFLKEINTSELESLFAIAEKQKEEDGAGGGKETKAKAQIIQLLDTKKSNNMSIMLTRFGKISHSEIKRAILELDENVFGPENINALIQFAPSPEEIELLSTFDGDKSLLGVPEKFTMEIMTIPRLEERLKAFGVKRSFEAKITTLKEALDVVSAAIAEAKNSKKFSGLLELTLAVGNYINGGTNRGRAFGFKLDSLHKLADVKTNNSSNLLGYIVDLIEAKYPHLNDVQDDFPHVGDACRESMQMLQGDIGKLKADLALVDRERTNEGHNAPGDKFKSIMTTFYEAAAKQHTACEEQFKKMEENYKTTCQFYCEDPKQDSQTFFDSINRFLASLDKVKKDNQRRKAAAEKAAKAAAAPKPTPKGAGAAGAGGEKGVLDNLIEGMKTGEAFAAKGRGRGMPGMMPGMPPNPMAAAGGANVANEALAMFAKFKSKGAK